MLLLWGIGPRVRCSSSRAKVFAERLQRAGYAVADSVTSQIRVIYAGSERNPGMQPDDPLPVDPTPVSGNVGSGRVMKPPVTRFDHARGGCQTEAGEAVMLYQLDDQIEFFEVVSLNGGSLA